MGPFQGLTVYSQKDILKNIEEIQVLDGTIGTSETVLVCIGKLTVMVGHICTNNIPVSFLFRKNTDFLEAFISHFRLETTSNNNDVFIFKVNREISLPQTSLFY